LERNLDAVILEARLFSGPRTPRGEPIAKPAGRGGRSFLLVVTARSSSPVWLS